MRWLTLGLAIVPHTANADQDIEMVKYTAGKLARAGRVQSARDLAEHVLQQAGRSSKGTRLAWLAIADIYHRLGNNLESFIALACGLATPCEVDAEEALNETTLFVRLLRDTHLWQVAREALRTARDLANNAGLDKRYRVRLGTLALQVRLTECVSDPTRSQEKLSELMREVLLNCGAVLDAGDDPGPTAVMLAQILRMAAEAGMSAEPAAAEMLQALLDAADPVTGSMARILSSDHPTAEDVLALLNKLQAATYPEDVGYDVSNVAQLARRLLAGKEAASSPEVAAFAIELLADRAVATPGQASVAAPPSAPTTISVPSTLAKELSLAGVSVVMAGLDSDWRLVRLTATAGRIGDLVREEESVFSSARLQSWAEEFPYRYGIDDTTFNMFYTSTEGIGLSDLPNGRVVLVADTVLQQVPPNLLLVDRDLAGRSRPMAAAPSLSWLAVARGRAGGGNGKLSAWISSAEKYGLTLAMIADRLGPTFARYAFDVDRGLVLPERMGGSEIAVIAAHGSIMPNDRYFQLVADEGELRVIGSDLACTLRNANVVILFVCSGGRLDRHPSSSTTVGLAKQLLDRGCSAVVASPWPLDSRVPYHWLPEFLRVWEEGGMLIDANFAANKSVAVGLGEDPARCLAMSVYGDPFRVKTPQRPSDSQKVDV
jgi:hypothetical protein